MKHTSLLALIIAFLPICSFKAPEKFVHDGVSINIPAGWVMGERGEVGSGYTVNFNSLDTSTLVAGFVAVVWVNKIRPLDEVALDHIASLKTTYTRGDTAPQFNSGFTTTYGDQECTRVDMVLPLGKVTRRATFYCFHLCGKTVTVIEMGAEEHAKKNKVAFMAIEQSFTCK